MINIGMNPVLFTIGGFSLRWYGIMVVLAIVVAIVWTLRAAKRAGIPEDIIYTSALWAIPFGMVGSRLVHVVDQLDYFIQNPREIIGTEGLTIFGAILGAAFGIWVYSKVKGFSFGRIADLVAPGAILAQAVGRVGCTINGCCYGAETSLPWGIIYSHPNAYAPLGIAVHPTQVYELMWDLLLFAGLLRLRSRLSPDGSLFLFYLAIYSMGRFFISFLRAGAPFIISGLQQAQLISLLVLVVTIPLLIARTRWVKVTPLAAGADEPTIQE